ncbi:hypothetical protein [Corynebacterium sputi]|uniref:hypothetical protein n=1 Tax=Corynebacterium sputi TaxID=489915 RepID=UPI0004294DB6|nr:hypothetical protein [Corynebacterium sputi]
MCRAVKCRTCTKTTWAGCGQHVAMVKQSVPASQWCDGQHSQEEIDAANAHREGLFSRIFGR